LLLKAHNAEPSQCGIITRNMRTGYKRVSETQFTLISGQESCTTL